MPGIKFRPRVPRGKPKIKTSKVDTSGGLSGLYSDTKWLKKGKAGADRYFLSLLRVGDAIRNLDVDTKTDQGLTTEIKPFKIPNVKLFTIALHDSKKDNAIVGTGQGRIYKAGSRIVDPTSLYYDNLAGKLKYEYETSDKIGIPNFPKDGRVSKKGDFLYFDHIVPNTKEQSIALNKIGMKATTPVTQDDLVGMSHWVQSQLEDSLDPAKLMEQIKGEAHLKLGEGTLEKTLGLRVDKKTGEIIDDELTGTGLLGPDLVEGVKGHALGYDYGGLPLAIGRKDALTGLRSLGEMFPSAKDLAAKRVTGTASEKDRVFNLPLRRTYKKGIKFDDIKNVDHIKPRLDKAIDRSLEIVKTTPELTTELTNPEQVRRLLNKLNQTLTGEDLGALSYALQNWDVEDSFLTTLGKDITSLPEDEIKFPASKETPKTTMDRFLETEYSRERPIFEGAETLTDAQVAERIEATARAAEREANEGSAASKELDRILEEEGVPPSERQTIIREDLGEELLPLIRDDDIDPITRTPSPSPSLSRSFQNLSRILREEENN